MSATLPIKTPIKTEGQKHARKQIYTADKKHEQANIAECANLANEAEDERLIAGYSLASGDDCPLCKKYRARGYNAATLAAIEEGRLLANDPNVKTYTVNELFAELNADADDDDV